MEKVPANPAKSFREALQTLRIIHYSLWLGGIITILWEDLTNICIRIFRHDIDAGVLTQNEAYDLVVDFFLSLNRDSDTYVVCSRAITVRVWYWAA